MCGVSVLIKRLAVLVVCTFLWGIPYSCSYANDIKEPCVCGLFYPSNPVILKEQVDDCIKKASPQGISGRIFALICPHAGIQFSGPTAAFGYKLVKDKPYKTVVVIGPSHYHAFSGASVYPKGVFRTPLGDIKIDEELTSRLLGKDPVVVFDPMAFTKEHSIEVQLPFLQAVLSDFKLVPIVMGDCSFSDCKKLAELLKSAIGTRKDVLVVASTDFYHGYDFQEAKTTDMATLSCIAHMDAKGLFSALEEGKAQLCGGLPVVTTLLLSGAFGCNKVTPLRCTNSAEATNKMQTGTWTVGYGSLAVYEEKGAVPMLSQSQKKELLLIARNSIKTYLENGKKMAVQASDPAFLEVLGAFVTLHEHGHLRGCIGSIIGRDPLYLTVRDMAVEAAVRDPRFAPLQPGELNNIDIEISVLSPMKRVVSAEEIKLGDHGVLVRKGFNSGVFLPQVATETGWTKEEFLDNLCQHKAGLNPRAWQDKATELYVFTAEVFSEKDTRTNE
ncbi:MAG: AmmeMemoRadiSam system protein B [Candidatus Omnitrophica bacterium]|nr:AmmeMemoRadiSam system protein B [Candidatus Omnitrophota bacterium]